MAPTVPSTRRNLRITPPLKPRNGRHADTIKKTHFYDALDKEYGIGEGKKSMRQIAREQEVSEFTGRKWKKEREQLGSMAYRHTRSRSTKLGRRSKMTPAICKMLISPRRNPVRFAPLEAQLAYHNIPVKRRQATRKIAEHTNRGRIYKAAFVKKKISDSNKAGRVAYSREHKDKSIEDFWQFVVFTDEAHVDPTSLCAPQVLREVGTRYDDENIVERGERKGVRFYVAGWINWHEKAEKLEFYHDEEDEEIQPPMPRKPRRRPTTETEEEYQARVVEWEALRPHKVDVRPQGNSMTQKYYTERLLPVYIEAVQRGRLRDSGPWLL